MPKENESADVVIIGAGIIGCAIAYKLVKRRLSVIVVERGRPGGEASSAAGGILAPQAEAHAWNAFFDLSLKSRALHADLAEEMKMETGLDVEYRSNGILYLAHTETDSKELEHRSRWQSESGLPVERLSSIEAARVESAISSTARSALFFPKEAQVNNVILTKALESAAINLGGRFVTGCSVEKVLIKQGREDYNVEGVETEHGKIIAPWVVNAAGSWAGLIDMGLQYQIPVTPVRGQMISIQSNPPIINRVIYSSRGYLVPRLDGRILVGSTMESAGYTKETTVGGIAYLLQTATEIAPALEKCAFGEAWAGLRPCAPDHLPVIGPTEIGGLVLATGFCRNGILLAPITADLITEYIISRRPSPELESFKPTRFNPKN